MSWYNIDITTTGGFTSSLATELAAGIAGYSGRHPLHRLKETVTKLNTRTPLLSGARATNNAALLCEVD